MGVTVTEDVTTVEVNADTTVTVTESVTSVSVSDSTATLTIQPSETSVAVSGNTTSISVEAESQEVLVNESSYLGNFGSQTLNGTLTTTGTITAPNLDISTQGSVTTNIATGTAIQGSGTKILNLGTGFAAFADLTTVNIGTQYTSGQNLINVGSGVSVSGNEDTINLKGNVNVDGDIVVASTVDGRDISIDGAKLDTIATNATATLYHRVSELRLAGNTSTGNYLYLSTSDQNLGQATNIYHPSTPEDTARLVDVEWTTYWGYTSAQNDTRLTLQLIVPVGATTQNLGTVTEVSQYDPNYSSRGSGQKWYYVSGDVAHHFTPFGRMSQSSSGSLKHTIVSSQYDPNTNRTYFCLKIATANMVTNDTAYWHPYAWESTYTLLTKSYDITERYRSGLDRNKVSFKLPFTDATLTFRLKIKELASGDNAQVADSVVRLTSMGV